MISDIVTAFAPKGETSFVHPVVVISFSDSNVSHGFYESAAPYLQNSRNQNGSANFPRKGRSLSGGANDASSGNVRGAS